MKLALINDWSGFHELQAEWNTLLIQSNANTLFLTYEWLDAWSKTNSQSLPFIITVRDSSEQLVGIAPLYLSKLTLLKCINLRTLRILADTNSGSEYPALITQNTNHLDITNTIIEYLESLKTSWDCIWLPNMAGWTNNYKHFTNTLRQQAINYNIRERSFSSLRLPESYVEYKKQLSKSRRKNLQQIENQAKRLGEISITLCETIEDLPFYIETLFDLHSQRWGNGQCNAGSFYRKPLMADFYRKFLPLALENKWLRFYILSIEKKPCAIQIGYEYNGVYYAMQEGFDPHSQQGIGNLLRGKSIELLINDNIREYDFLGVHTQHKARWQAEERIGYDIFAWNKNLKNIFLNLKPIWPTGRFLKAQ